MKNGMLSWLLNNHIKSETDLDQLVGPVIYIQQDKDSVKLRRANTAFEQLFGWQGYNWQRGVDIGELLPEDSRKRFLGALDKAAQKLWNQVVLNIELSKQDGKSMFCKACVFCIDNNVRRLKKYLVRLEYDLENEIKDALFTEALCQSKVNCWYWDMSQGTAAFFNTDIPKEPIKNAEFMSGAYAFVHDFPQEFASSLDFVGEYRDVFMAFVKSLFDSKLTEDVHCEIAFRAGDGQVIWISFTSRTVKNANGKPEYALGTWKNITEQKTNEQQQQQNNYLMDNLIKGSLYDITVNVDKNFFEADDSLEKWMEETQIFSAYYDQAIKEIAEKSVAKEDRQRFLDFFALDNIRRLPEGEDVAIEYRRVYRGKKSWFKATVNTFRLDETRDKWMYVLVYDIDAAKKKEIELEKKASTDALTGLYNRNSSLSLMEEYIKKYPKSANAVVYMDLDNFKSVNDTLGHAAGDSMLICVADSMREYFGADAILGRIGGDEFIFMCYNAEHEYVDQMMQSFVEYTAKKCQAECPSVKVTVSLGYVLYPDFGSDVAVLAGLADKALYKAKRHGKNTAVAYTKQEDDNA